MSKTQYLVLIRHAHRDKPDPSADNGLSPRGRAQVRWLGETFRHWVAGQWKGERLRFVSSPARRCVETIAPLARACRMPLDEGNGWAELLREQAAGESAAALRVRINRFARAIGAAPVRSECLVACSHGDWLPIAMQRLLGAPHLAIEFRKGAIAILARSEAKSTARGGWELRQLVSPPSRTPSGR